MLLIIDANVASEFEHKTEEAKAIAKWLRSKGRLSVGGKNLVELSIVSRFASFLLELRRSGRSIVVSSEQIESELGGLEGKGLVSNDEHVIGLALAGGARLLYTKDEPLIKDFKNKNIIDSPRGKCYRDAEKHARLLA